MNTLTREQILSIPHAMDFKTILEPFRRMVAEAIGAKPQIGWDVRKSQQHCCRRSFTEKQAAEAWIEKNKGRYGHSDCKIFEVQRFDCYEGNPAADLHVLNYVKRRGFEAGRCFAVAMDAVWRSRECPHAFRETTCCVWWKYEVGDYSKALLLSRMDGGAT